MLRYPQLNKKTTLYFLSLFPKQSTKVKSVVLQQINTMTEKNFDFNDLMNKLFWSKNINARAGYFHFRTLLQRNNHI